MKTKEFSFELPEELIAQTPLTDRSASRLMTINPQDETITHGQFRDILSQIEPGTVVVLNNSKVRKARLFAETANGGKVELLFLESEQSGNTWNCLINKSKRIHAGQILKLPGEIEGTILSETGNVRLVSFNPQISEEYLEEYGNIPLPPYIRRPSNEKDSLSYQNIFAQTVGSAAAPTAGLHFTDQLINDMKQKGIIIVYVTLHVGLGTFLPVRTDEISDHKMHKERFFMSKENAQILEAAKIENRKVLAVGTTSVRTLESSWNGKNFNTGWQDTDIFIYPGYQFKVVDQICTNFHTPESTLLMLVSAFAGWDFIKLSYEEAIKNKYRFFSYGDAMFISCPKK